MIKRVSTLPVLDNKNKTEKPKKKKKKDEEKQFIIVNNIQGPEQEYPELRTISLYGDITEKKGSEVVAALLYFQNTAFTSMPENREDPESNIVPVAKSINMFISTHGGSASDMFSILDVMEMVKKNTCDIETYGMGKVMSAGLPILAAGSPGKRKVGRNCRIMLHNVMAGTGGTIFSMENELEEIKWVQDRYIECLAGYTKMTAARIKKILKTQKDTYFSAEEAIKMGIADEII